MWIEDNTALVGFLALLVAVLVPVLTWVYAHFGGVSIREKLEDRASWDALIEQFSGTAGDAYSGALDKVLGFAERVYGPKPLSWNAFGRCLTIAYVYPVIAFLTGWMPFHVGEVGGFRLLPDSDAGLDRLWRGSVVALAGVFAGWIAYRAEPFSLFVVGQFDKMLATTTVRAVGLCCATILTLAGGFLLWEIGYCIWSLST